MSESTTTPDEIIAKYFPHKMTITLMLEEGHGLPDEMTLTPMQSKLFRVTVMSEEELDALNALEGQAND